MSLERYKEVIPEDFARDADFIDRVIKGLGLPREGDILDIGTDLGVM